MLGRFPVKVGRIDRYAVRYHSKKDLAAMPGTSLSRLVSDKLPEAIRGKEAYIIAREKALAQLKKGFHSAGRPPSRDELHKR